jgi:hypothetical protein
MDRLTRAEHFRKMAVKYEELARFTQPACLSDFYRSYAVRYGLMAQEASERAEKEENAVMRVLKNRRDLHEVIADQIATDRTVGASQREGRAARRGLPKVKRIRVRRSS